MSSAWLLMRSAGRKRTGTVARPRPVMLAAPLALDFEPILVSRISDRVVPGGDAGVAGRQLARVQTMAMISAWLTRTSVRRPGESSRSTGSVAAEAPGSPGSPSADPGSTLTWRVAATAAHAQPLGRDRAVVRCCQLLALLQRSSWSWKSR